MEKIANILHILELTMAERNSKKDASIVIGFKDWGLSRLELAVRSLSRSVGEYDVEIIISDFGSAQPENARLLADKLNVNYVYTYCDGPWSRSRALNAGFARSSGSLLISTDADMIFSPTSIEKIVETSIKSPNSALFLQCRDLPEQFDEQFVLENPNAWEEFEATSRLRPRWGMGGMMAIPREGYLAIRGFDERFHTYGGEDIDFAQRAKWAGYKTHWIDDPEVRMYHVWHESTSELVAKEPRIAAAVRANRDIVENDRTYVRNLHKWEHPPKDAQLLISVIILLSEGGTNLPDSLKSVLAQSIQDFEVIVVDQGQEGIAEIVSNVGDGRVKHYSRPNGSSAERFGFAVENSTGYFSLLIDEDSILLPQSLEWHLQSMQAEVSSSVGLMACYEYHRDRISMYLSKRQTFESAVARSHLPKFGSFMTRTELLTKSVTESLFAADIIHHAFIFMYRSGARVKAIEKVTAICIMNSEELVARSLKTLIERDSSSIGQLLFGQSTESHAFLNEEMVNFGMEIAPSVNESYVSKLRFYLPDELVTRSLRLNGANGAIRELALDGSLLGSAISIDEQTVSESFELSLATYEDMAKLSQRGISFEPTDPGDVNQFVRDELHWIDLVEKWLAKEDSTPENAWFVFAPFEDGMTASLGARVVRIHELEKEEDWIVMASADPALIREFTRQYVGSLVRGNQIFGEI